MTDCGLTVEDVRIDSTLDTQQDAEAGETISGDSGLALPKSRLSTVFYIHRRASRYRTARVYASLACFLRLGCRNREELKIHLLPLVQLGRRHDKTLPEPNRPK
jgi:hypothetical protein